MKDAKKIITELKKRSEKTTDKEESKSLLNEAKNMVEKYDVKAEDCQSIPVCYDTTVQRCDETNFCCIVNKIDAE